jgi:hypothetical protein
MSNVKNIYNTEASLKSCIVKVFASATLLFMVEIQTSTEDLFILERTVYTPVMFGTRHLL